MNQVTVPATLPGTLTLAGTTTGANGYTTSCGGGSGPEVSYYFTTCPAFAATQFSASTCGAATWDTILEQRSARRATPAAICDDDGCDVQRSIITGTLPAGAGLHTVIVDGFGGASGAYTNTVRFGSCPAGQTLCGSVCVNAQIDRNNCGACARVCPTAQSCVAGVCACTTGQLFCSNACINPQTDRNNCGRCGNVCAAALTCTAGACVCPTGTNLCGAACVNLTNNASNCGTCGTVCPTGATCANRACVCPTGQTACGNTCRTLATDNSNCGACGRVCAAGNNCQAGACRPTNNDRANAITLSLGTAETTVNSTNANATFDGPTTCSSTTTNVWYRIVLAAREVLYADTAGGTTNFDTRLFLTDVNGAMIANSCNDDSGCGATGGFTSGLQSRFAVVVNAGTYFLSVGGHITQTGNFTLRVQHIRANIGSFFYDTQLTGNTSTATFLVGTSANTGTCGGTASGEDVRWFLTCGGQAQFFSLCPSDGGTYTRRINTTNYDPSMYIYSGVSASQVVCNDDGGAGCAGTGGDSALFGSRLNNVVVGRGIHAHFVDERVGGSGMRYTLRYTVR